MKKARIIWLGKNAGGKQKEIQLNIKYYVIIKEKQADNFINWSFVITNELFTKENETISFVEFLMSDAPHQYLKKKFEFDIYEGGSKLIAHGIVIE